MTKSEALAKVKQLMKEAIAKKGAMATFKYSFVEDNLNNLHMALQLGKMTGDDAENTIQQIEGVLAQYGAKTATNASGTMTPEEYKAQKSVMYKKYKNGEITNYAYIQWKKKNDPAKQAAAGAGAASGTSGGTSAGTTAKAAKTVVSSGSKTITEEDMANFSGQITQKYASGQISQTEYNALNKALNDMWFSGNKPTVAEAEAQLGLDPGTMATQKAVDDMEKELKQVYGDAAKEMQAKLDAFQKAYGDKLAKKQELVKQGKMTSMELNAWMQGQMATDKLLHDKIEQLQAVATNANQKAMGMINGEQVGVFAENANYQSYQLTQDAKMNLMFSVYDESTAEKLLKDKPELLPPKVVNGKKDKAWNKKIIANSMLQGVIQGEGIPALAKRIANDTASTNMNAMVRYARTAMTAAQNAGRQEMLHRAKGMGIKVKKRWLATLDKRTRDAHQKLDGQTVDVDQPFTSDLGDIMYPGDPSADPGNVYNCRCTMVYVYEDYPMEISDEMRRDNETGELITDMNYDEWKAAKEGSMLNDLNVAKVELADVQKKILQKKINEDKIYKDLWKDEVTLKDYPAKAAGIKAKRDYYTAEIEKLEKAIANGESWAKPEKLKELEKKRKLLNEFEMNGKLIAQRDAALAKVQNIYTQTGLQKTATPNVAIMKKAKKAKTTKTASGTAAASGSAANGTSASGTVQKSMTSAGQQKTQFASDSWDAKTKKAAVYHERKRDADKMLRPELDAMWDTLTDKQKYSVWQYTRNSNPINKRLSGYGDTYDWSRTDFVGFGNTNWGLEDTWRSDELARAFKKFGKDGHPEYHKVITELTSAIEKAPIKQNTWFKRKGGQGDFAGMMEGGGFKFEQVVSMLDGSHSQKELDAMFVGQKGKNNAFTSVAIAKDAQWPGNIWYNIYCPKGTKGIYAEPQSHYGNSSGGSDRIYKKGDSYSSIGSEAEVILQRGTEYRITGIRQTGVDWRGNPEFTVDMEVVGQPDYFVYGDEDTYNDGKTRHKK